MLDTVTALTPVFLVITLGLLVRRIHYIPDTVWPALDQVCWHLLFPILIIRTLSKADLAAVQFGNLAGAFIIAACAMVILLFLLKPLLHKLLGMTGPGYTSFFQGTSRWMALRHWPSSRPCMAMPGLFSGHWVLLYWCRYCYP